MGKQKPEIKTYAEEKKEFSEAFGDDNKWNEKWNKDSSYEPIKEFMKSIQKNENDIWTKTLNGIPYTESDFQEAIRLVKSYLKKKDAGKRNKIEIHLKEHKGLSSALLHMKEREEKHFLIEHQGLQNETPDNFTYQVSAVLDYLEYYAYQPITKEQIRESGQILKKNKILTELLYNGLYGMDIKLTKKHMNALDEVIILKRLLLSNLSYNNKKILFERDKEIVRQNGELYPIMLVHFDYIKNIIIENQRKKGTDKEVFEYIAKLTFHFKKWTAVKQYYHDKYLTLPTLELH